jgi:hypothetical protein
MLEKMICGSQTGAGQAALRAAKAFGVAVPGRTFERASSKNSTELPDHDEMPRADRDVRDSDGTLWFGQTTTSDAHATVAACQRLGKPCLPVYPGVAFEPSQVANWIVENRIRTLNVAGNREPEEPGIAARVEQFLGSVLQSLGHHRV